MADRYFRVDVSFFHKRTCQTLLDKLGPGGPLVYLSLVARAKDSGTPGTFIFSSDAIAWEKLGFDSHDFGFTLDEFLKVTGRMKQTSRTRVGRLSHVKLTQYERWQQDSKRYEAAVRKSRSRGKNDRDKPVTPVGLNGDTRRDLRTRSRSTPKPPRGKVNCPHCGRTPMTPSQLADHLENVHGIYPEVAA